MILELVKRLRGTKDVVMGDGALLDDVADIEERFGVTLPADLTALLGCCDGVTVFAGFARIFGTGRQGGVGVGDWNDEDWWKFAWNSRCSPYLVFAETCWGDQYCFDLNGLRKGRHDVLILDALSMTPSPIASSFTDFLTQEFMTLATDPYDVMTKLARSRFGGLDGDQHLVYTPSILLGGEEKVDNVVVMDAKAAMIVNGDIATQIDAAADGEQVKRIDTWLDDRGRTRLTLVFS